MIVTDWIADHSLYVLLGIGTIFTYGWIFSFREKLNMHWFPILIYSIIHTIFGVLCVTVFAFAEAGFNMDAVGNMSLYGGVFFMPVLYFIFAKLFHKKTADVFDICTVCMIFTLMCARLNCLIAGCCLGNLIPGTTLRYPTREAEIAFYIILLIILGNKVKKTYTNGTIYPIYMIAYGVFRFITEGFRYTDSSLLIHLGHIWSVVSLILGYSIYIEIKKKGRRRKV